MVANHLGTLLELYYIMARARKRGRRSSTVTARCARARASHTIARFATKGSTRTPKRGSTITASATMTRKPDNTLAKIQFGWKEDITFTVT